ncbi:Flp family type IVb pilin [Porphyrobacter algicida]|uniref:Flp family type IVb pilin n=2 Tax=Qipengyuania algicida TaxID=1836209 RepID=A0A845AJ83_9SPHN|nr:Flp family type IVb pilin [Qipengyuania algicida]
MPNLISRILRDESGATAVEYGLIVALVFLVMLGAVQAFGKNTISMWNNVSTTVSNASA